MLDHSQKFADGMVASAKAGAEVNVSQEMTELTFAILAETLFSGEIVRTAGNFAEHVDKLLHTMGRIDPMDLLQAPSFVPRVTRWAGQRPLNHSAVSCGNDGAAPPAHRRWQRRRAIS